MSTSGLTASSQNCCSRLAAPSAVLAAGGTFAVTTGSIFAHLILRESGVPCPFALATFALLSSLDPKVVSRNADVAFDSVKSGTCVSSHSSDSLSVAGSSSSSILGFFPEGGYRQPGYFHRFVACQTMIAGLDHCVWYRVLTSGSRPVWT